jgi:hypothetical protein
MPHYHKILNNKIEKLTKKLARFGLPKAFSPVQLSKNRDGVLKVVGQESIEIRNRYEVIPWAEGQEMTTWFSINPGLGALEGTFTIVEDCILSQYQDEKGNFSGAEVIIKTACNRYLNRGVLVYKGKDKLSSWSVELLRDQNPQT